MITNIKLQDGTYRYDDEQPLGRPGGFGRVYIGWTSKGLTVAIKKLNISSTLSAHRELKIAKELARRSFQYIVPFVDSGEDADSGNYFIVMEKADKSLQDDIDRIGVTTSTETGLVLLQIAKGLAEVPEIVHRDLKPGNILLHQDKWKISDFGIARFYEEATSINTLRECLTPQYAAPEQCRLERSTHATDLYSLGCIGYCLLVGNPPFMENPIEQHQREAVPPFTCDEPRLSALIYLLLRKNPETRPNIERVKQLLSDIVTNPRESTKPTSFSELAAAGSRISEEEQRKQAREAAEKKEADSRKELKENAYKILAENIERLWGKIQIQAPSARLEGLLMPSRVKKFAPSFWVNIGIRLGNGILIVKPAGESLDFSGTESFPQSKWDVAALATMKVSQSKPDVSWEASLWYAKIKDSTEFRWYEVGYFAPFSKGIVNQPFAVTNLGDADNAAASRILSFAIAYGPLLVDDEKEPDFHVRWAWLLAKASMSELMSPSQFPIFKLPPY